MLEQRLHDLTLVSFIKPVSGEEETRSQRVTDRSRYVAEPERDPHT